MTEKRFNDAKGYIYDKKTCIGIIQDDYTCENVVDLLNSLNDENEQLKQFIKELTSRDEKIWLSSGYVYDVKKVLKDGDV